MLRLKPCKELGKFKVVKTGQIVQADPVGKPDLTNHNRFHESNDGDYGIGNYVFKKPKGNSYGFVQGNDLYKTEARYFPIQIYKIRK
jgi:hypothetical protein